VLGFDLRSGLPGLLGLARAALDVLDRPVVVLAAEPERLGRAARARPVLHRLGGREPFDDRLARGLVVQRGDRRAVEGARRLGVRTAGLLGGPRCRQGEQQGGAPAGGLPKGHGSSSPDLWGCGLWGDPITESADRRHRIGSGVYCWNRLLFWTERCHVEEE